MTPLKILHLNAGNLFGGIEVNLLSLARHRHLCPEMTMMYGACYDDQPALEMRATGVPVSIFGSVRLSRPWTVMLARQHLAEWLESNPCDAVVVHGSWLLVIFAKVIRQYQRRLVFWSHDQMGSGGWLDRLARYYRPDLIICNSEYTHQSIQKTYPGIQSSVLYCPLAPPTCAPSPNIRQLTRKQFGITESVVIIVQVGRWESHKGHHTLIQALKKIRAVPNWICWQIGAPQKESEQQYFNTVRLAAEEANIAERVTFLGWQPELGNLLASADLYCQPNDRPEPFGIAIIEAMYSQLPVVAVSEGGPCEIVTEECGRLVSPGDTSTLSRVLHELIVTPTLRTVMGSAGVQRAKFLCDPEQQILKLYSLMNRQQ